MPSRMPKMPHAIASSRAASHSITYIQRGHEPDGAIVRPVTPFTRTQILELVSRLEIPDCNCKLERLRFCELEGQPCVGNCECPHLYRYPPCEHVLARNHSFPWDKWVQLMHLSDPQEYGDRPLAPPSNVLSREARVGVMQIRFSCGLGLFNERDRWNKRVSELKIAPVVSEVSRNGQDGDEFLVVTGR